MKKTLSIVLILGLSGLLYSQGVLSNEGIPMQSGGSDLIQSAEGIELGPLGGEGIIPLNLTSSFLAMNFDNNVAETGGWMFIPPDPIGAAGTDRVIAVTNVMIEALTKAGGFLWRDALKDFFTTLTPANWTGAPSINPPTSLNKTVTWNFDCVNPLFFPIVKTAIRINPKPTKKKAPARNFIINSFFSIIVLSSLTAIE